MVSSSGQMADATVVNGLMENSMEREPMFLARASKNMENGKKEKESDG